MPLTLDQYASYLEGRDLPWPAPPKVDVPKVRPHLPKLEGIKGVAWTVYGTLLSILEGELKFEVVDDFQMNVALEKTIHEFKMWGSMSRKPGQPSEYMREIYKKALDEQRLAPSEDKHPELLSEKIWEGIIKKLFQKEYKFDAGFFGPLPEYAKKVAYFFHASLQGTRAHENAATVLERLDEEGIKQGLLADGQCFTITQLNRGLAKQASTLNFNQLLPSTNRTLSCDHRARKPSDAMFQAAIEAFGKHDLEPSSILHIGSSLTRDIAPAKSWGMRTALFAGDRGSLDATPEQLKDPRSRPDALLTDLSQVLDILASIS